MVNETTQHDSSQRETITRLSQALGDRALVQLTLNSVQTVDRADLEDALKTRYDCQPRMMLTLLVYCYAVGIYGSRQIRQAMRDNATVRYLCAKEFPDERTLRKFRKENRALIKQCLNQVFKQAWALKFDQAEADFLGYEWFESVLSAQICSESINRIDLAAFMDVMQWDLD